MYFHLLLWKLVYNLHSEWVVFFFCFFRIISYSRSVLSKPVRNIWGFGTWSTAKLSVSRRYYFYVYKSVTRNILDIHFPYRIVNGEVESSRHKTTLSRRPNPAYKKRTNYLLRNEGNETYKALYFFFFINNAGSERLRFAWESDKCLILGFGILCSPDLVGRKRGIRYRSEESRMSSRVENRCSQIARVVRTNLELSSTKISQWHYYLTYKNAPGVKNPLTCVERFVTMV